MPFASQQPQDPCAPQDYMPTSSPTTTTFALTSSHAAARERQRKHRQLFKQRKMRERGMDMGNEVMGPSRRNSLHTASTHQQTAQNEPPFPQGAHGGQTFATTLLLSFSCTPLLRQHLLSSLNMSNEELASLEPVLAEAWDRWDQGRCMRTPPPGYPAPPPLAKPNPNANAGITNPHANISNPHTPPNGTVNVGGDGQHPHALPAHRVAPPRRSARRRMRLMAGRAGFRVGVGTVRARRERGWE
ncbi:hypothetical protein C8R46DRAFT_1306339 [Mycena filopes]|nr:hypothetical protein C8R46DRAFT_1306339 [Mycena filopes]